MIKYFTILYACYIFALVWESVGIVNNKELTKVGKRTLPIALIVAVIALIYQYKFFVGILVHFGF